MPHPEILDFLLEIDLDRSDKLALVSDLNRTDAVSSQELNELVRDKYDVDLRGEYAGINLPHPFGKAAGQLSMTASHIESDKSNGLAYTVLKSAVGVTEDGEIGIDDWQKSAPKMVVKKRVSRRGRTGWTVSWKGRGWDKGFENYLDLYKDSLKKDPEYPVIPSMMVDVTDSGRAKNQAEFCLGKLIEIHREVVGVREFLVEIDISPTLALLPGSENVHIFRRWVKTSVEGFRHGLKGRGKFILKLPNAGLGPVFQLALVNDALDVGGGSVRGIIIGNRLFDRKAEFEGQKGIAYGGYDLSDANFETLDRLLALKIFIPLTGTGNICSGKMMGEYGVRGCMSGQMHTFFQLPASAYRAPEGAGRIWRVLRELIFHPDDGLISILLKLEKAGYMVKASGLLRFRDLPKCYSPITGIY